MDALNFFEAFADYETTPSVTQQVGPVYQALPKGSIRLLTILPGDDSAEICCKLDQYTLHAEPVYTALSYAWGSGPDNHTILLNGRRTYIRKNLWRFLHEARKLVPKKLNLLWIDALCIDQSYKQERTHQVNLMPQIYQDAAQVVIWLGPAYNMSNEAMDNLARISSDRTAKQKPLSILRSPAGTYISLLCKRQYWTRLWVFQEVLLAREIWVMCGDRSAPWEPLRDIILTVHGNKSLSRRKDARLEDSIAYQAIKDSPAKAIVTQTGQQRDGMNLYDLMVTTRNLRCTEPRDRVYALLGMACSGSEVVDADYDTPVPTLFNTVLRTYHTLKPPGSVDEVADQCRTLAEMFGIPDKSIFEITDGHGCLPAPEAEDVAKYPIGPIRTPITLWWASFYNHSVVVDLIVKDRRTRLNEWLQRAAASGSEATLRLILDSDVRSSRAYGDALEHACWYGHAKAVQILIDAGVDLNARTTFRGSHLQAASGSGHEKVVQMLLDAGADVNARRHHQNNALQAASSGGYDRVVQILLDAKADVNAKGKHGPSHTALRAASAGGHEKVIQLLLDAGADVNVRGSNALLAASAKGHEKVVQMLINVGADVNAQAKQWEYYLNALQAASANGHEKVVRILQDAGAREQAVPPEDYKEAEPWQEMVESDSFDFYDSEDEDY